MFTVCAFIVGFMLLLVFPSALILPTSLSYVTIRKREKVIPLSFLMALFWGFAGYHFKNPATDPDLVRYLDMLKLYAGKSLFESFNLQYENLFAVDVYFHFVSKLNNPQFLPAFSVFIFYFITFYLLADYKIRTNLTNKTFVFYLVFVLTSINFCSIVNGIRWPLAYIIIFLAVYRELIQGKRDAITLFFYVVPLFLHFSTLIFIALRLGILIKNKKLVFLIGASAVSIPTLFNILNERLSVVNGVVLGQLQYFTRRGNMYFQWSDSDGGWAKIVKQSTYYRLESYFYYAVVALFAIFLYMTYRNDNKKMWEGKNLYVLYLAIVTVVSFTMSGHTYIRFVTPLIVSMSCVFFPLMKQRIDNNLGVIFIDMGLVALSCIGLFLNFHLLNSMVDLNVYFSDVFTSGILRFFIK